MQPLPISSPHSPRHVSQSHLSPCVAGQLCTGSMNWRQIRHQHNNVAATPSQSSTPYPNALKHKSGGLRPAVVVVVDPVADWNLTMSFAKPDHGDLIVVGNCRLWLLAPGAPGRIGDTSWSRRSTYRSGSCHELHLGSSYIFW
jgi:hypothetical protein